MPKKSPETLKFGTKAYIKAIKDKKIPIPPNAKLITTKSGKTQLRGLTKKELNYLSKIDVAEEPKVPKNKLFEVQYKTAPNRKSEYSMTYNIKQDYCYFSEPFLDEHKELLLKVLAINSKKKLSNHYVMIKLYYEDDEDKKVRFSILFDREEINLTNMLKKIKYKMEQNSLSYERNAQLKSISVSVRPLSFSGGCDIRRHVNNRKFDNVDLISPKSKPESNNCLLMCYIDFLELSGVKEKPDNIRKQLNLPLKTEIHIDDIIKVNDYFKNKYNNNMSFVLYNENKQIIRQSEITDVLIELYLENHHYFYLQRKEVKITEKKKCPLCKKELLITNEEHVCNINRLRFNNYKGYSNNKFVEQRYTKIKYKLDYEKDYIFFSIDTNSTNNFLVASNVRFTYNSESINLSLSDFVKYLTQLPNYIYLITYGGADKENYLLLNECIKQKINISYHTKKDTQLFSFTTEFFKTFDLNLFLNDDFENSLEAFDSQNLKELFIKVNDIYYNQEQVNIVEFITISDCSYSLWTKKNKLIIEIVGDKKIYKMISSSCYGGRVLVMKHSFKSRRYDDIIKKKLTYNEIIKSKDFLVYLDVSSLFPAGCIGTMNIKVKFPVGFGRHSNNGESEYKNDKLGFYCISYIPPRDLRIPILPNKNKDHSVSWTLKSGEGIYTSEDIKNALRHNYKIKFLGPCFVYDNTSETHFLEFISQWYKLKSNNQAFRAISKITMNGFIGKLSQNPVLHDTELINNDVEFDKFVSTHKHIEYDITQDYPKLVNGEKLDLDPNKCNNKRPNQLGSFVYAYSRSIMLDIFEKLDPELKTPICYYSDTDSLLVTAEHYYKLKELGYVKKEIGFLSNELEKDNKPFPIVINAMIYGKKHYYLEYIDANNNLYLKNNAKLVLSGIMKKYLTFENLTMTTNNPVEFNTIKKTKDFQLQEITLTRKINNKTENLFIDGEFYPESFIFKE